MALQALVPPLTELPEAAQRAATMEPLLPLDVEGDRQYFLRCGRAWFLIPHSFPDCPVPSSAAPPPAACCSCCC